MPTKTQPSAVKTAPRAKANKPLLAPGHRGCAGCGQNLAARIVADALGPDTIIANATGCLEVTTTPYPESSWGLPWIHSLFENAAAVASGVLAALKQKGLDKKIKVVAQGGDGGTFDIGFGLISGMWERGDNILYVCYDNEAYSNTGMQASGATPLGSSTTTTPAGSLQRKKDMLAIALAHGLSYVAQTTVGYLDDIRRKTEKAASVDGPAYLQIMTPCIPGWRIRPDQALLLGKMGAMTGLYPVIEYENGRLASALKTPRPKIKVEKYLEAQGRFAHLFKSPAGKDQLRQIQKIADENIKKYGL